MKTVESLIDKHKGEPALIICAGASVKDKREDIRKFIEGKNPFTIGINNMTDFFIPNYHLWTNTQRFRTYGNRIHESSNILLGAGIHLKTMREVIGTREYTLINFTDMKEDMPVVYKKGKIYGFYRTAGCLSIMVAHLMGAIDIGIVGMDGYSLYKHKDLESGEESQHCYGKGLTDTADWETCVKKDKLIEKALSGLWEYGINFKILTPTKYWRFYDSIGLHV